jgi:hypothetical protein
MTPREWKDMPWLLVGFTLVILVALNKYSPRYSNGVDAITISNARRAECARVAHIKI